MCSILRKIRVFSNVLRKSFQIGRNFSKSFSLTNTDSLNESPATSFHSSRKFVSGIKPSGSIHLGNYLGAIQRWNSIKDKKEDLTLCIADMHCLATCSDPVALRKNIFNTAATLFSSGIDPNDTTVFIQSSIPQHFEMSWILSCHTTMNRLAQIPEVQEKSRKIKDIQLGFFVYPILQAADVILHRATHVPVGEDQVQNLNFAQTLIQNLNDDYGLRLPISQAYVERHEAGKIRSFKDPTKKMSKSDMDPKASIFITDSDDEIMDKFKKCTTDCISDIAYDPSARPGISNLISIYSLVTDKQVKDVVKEVVGLDGNRFKLLVAEAVIEHVKPIREKMKIFLDNQQEVITALEVGAEKAQNVAAPILKEIKERLGLGASNNIPEPIRVKSLLSINQDAHRKPEMQQRKANVDSPIVPIQKLRVEKRRQSEPSATSLNSPNFDGTGFPPQKKHEYASMSSVKSQIGELRYRSKF